MTTALLIMAICSLVAALVCIRLEPVIERAREARKQELEKAEEEQRQLEEQALIDDLSEYFDQALSQCRRNTFDLPVVELLCNGKEIEDKWEGSTGGEDFTMPSKPKPKPTSETFVLVFFDAAHCWTNEG